MNRMYPWHQFVLVHLGVLALGLSGRCLRGDDTPGPTMDPIQLADARRITQICEEVVKAFPPGERSRQSTTERDNVLAAVRDLPALMRREGSAVREGFAWSTAWPVTEDTFDIQQSLGFLTPHRPGISPSPTILELRTRDLDQVTEGMSSEDVAQILGKPDDSFEQNTIPTGYQKTVLYALAGNRTAFLWFGSDDRLSYKYPNRSAAVRMATGGPSPPSRASGVQPAVAMEPVRAPSPPAVATQPAAEPAPLTTVRSRVAVPDPSGIQIGDTVLVPAHSRLRTVRSTIYLQTDLHLRVVDVSGDQIGCWLRYADGDGAVAWVHSSSVVRAWQYAANPAVQPLPETAPPLGRESLQPVMYNADPATPAVRPQTTVYGASIITFDNQSGEPAVVRLVGPTPAEVHVANGGRNAIRRVAPGEYVVYIRYGVAGACRYTQGERFTVREAGLEYSNIAMTLHTVPGGNYRYHESSEDEFNRAGT